MSLYKFCLCNIKCISYDMNKIKNMSFELLSKDYISLYSNYGDDNGLTINLKSLITKLEREDGYGIRLKKATQKKPNIQKRTFYTSSIMKNSNFIKYNLNERCFYSNSYLEKRVDILRISRGEMIQINS